MKAVDYRPIVSVIPKEGMGKILKDAVLQHAALIMFLSYGTYKVQIEMYLFVCWE